MNSIRKSIMAAAAVALAALASPANAETPVTHHFSIVRPGTPVIVGTPVDFEITARLENNKINKRAEHTLLIQVTSAQGQRPQTLTREAELKRGVAKMTLTFDDVGPAILQVTDKADEKLTNSASISVLPQPRKREVRP